MILPRPAQAAVSAPHTNSWEGFLFLQTYDLWQPNYSDDSLQSMLDILQTLLRWLALLTQFPSSLGFRARPVLRAPRTSKAVTWEEGKVMKWGPLGWRTKIPVIGTKLDLCVWKIKKNIASNPVPITRNSRDRSPKHIILWGKPKNDLYS